MDYLEIRELYHSLQVDEERRKFLSDFDIYNRDFLEDLPYVIKDALDNLKWRFKQEDWFLEAWEKYRQHVLEAGLGGAIKMPGYIFKPYLEKYFDEHPERFGLLSNNCGECAYSDLDIGDYLEHHGIKGQKWGIRRFQNEDGSLTSEGKQRYEVHEVTKYKNGIEVKSQQMTKEGKKLYKKERNEDLWSKAKKKSFLEEMKRGAGIMAAIGGTIGAGAAIAQEIMLGDTDLGTMTIGALSYGTVAAGQFAAVGAIASLAGTAIRNNRIDVAKSRLEDIK